MSDNCRSQVVGDGPEITLQSFEDWKNNVGSSSCLSHPEGSFMAFVNDKSEEDITKLIQETSATIQKPETRASNVTLDTILPEVREQIWKRLSCLDLKNVRGTCRQFYQEISNEIGIQLYFVDSDDQSLRLALTTAIKRLVIVHLEMGTLAQLVPTHPLRLEELSIQGCVGLESLHNILLRCPNIQKLEIDHGAATHVQGPQKNDPISEENESYQNNNNTMDIFKDWKDGTLFKPEADIRYTYGMFNKLRHIQFRSGNTQLLHQINLVPNTLLPLLNCVHSPHLSIIDIGIFVLKPSESKIVTDAIFQLFLRMSHSIKNKFCLRHFHSDSYTFEPVLNVDTNNGKSSLSAYRLQFGEHRPVPQFKIINLEISEHVTGFFDWIFFLEHQRHLTSLTFDVGGHYWPFSVEAIKKSARTLQSITLRMLRCYQMGDNKMNNNSNNNHMIGSPVALPMSNFPEFIALKSLHLIGMDLATSQLSCIDLLPETIENIQIESFQLAAEQVFAIHRTLPLLKFMSLNHWNCTRDNFMSSLKVIAEMISDQGEKYKALTFLEKSMYSSVEELEEMNQLLNIIVEKAKNSGLQVDDVTGDNGIGFILVIGHQNKFTELYK